MSDNSQIKLLKEMIRYYDQRTQDVKDMSALVVLNDEDRASLKGQALAFKEAAAYATQRLAAIGEGR